VPIPKGLKRKEIISFIMNEFKKNKLHDSSGNIVKNKDQALAIALHKAGVPYKKKGKK